MPTEIEEQLKEISDRRQEFIDRGEGNLYDQAYAFSDDIFWLLGYVAILRGRQNPPQSNEHWFEPVDLST